MLYGTYDLKWMYFNGALWFIPCLFTMELLFWVVTKIKQQVKLIFVLLIFFVLGIYLKDNTPWLPFGLCASFIGIIFMGLGHISKSFFQKEVDLSKKQCFVLLLILLSLFASQVILLPYTGADLAALYIKNVWTYIPISCIGIILCLLLSNLLKLRVVEWIGLKSLFIFALQEPIYRVVIFVGTKCVGVDVETFRNSVVCCLGATVVTILIITILIFIYNMKRFLVK